MQKIKFDFEAKKHFIYTPNSAVPIGAPVDENGNIANDGNAIGIVLGYDNVNEKYWAKQMMVVMIAGYCDIIDAQEIWGDEYSAEAIAAMSDIIFCDDHKIGGGGGWPADLPKPSVGGYGYTEQGEQTVITWDGDTEGRDVLVLHSPYGDANFYKVAEKQSEYPENASVEVTYGDVTASADAELTEYTGAYAYNAEGQPYVIIASAGDINVGGLTGNAPSDGVYFIHGTSGEIITKLTYGTPETVHKIDEKYLPEAGGGGNDFIIELQNNYTLDSENLAICNQYVDFYKNGGANKPHSVTVLHKGNQYKVIGTNAYSDTTYFAAVNFETTINGYGYLERTDVNVIAFDYYAPENKWTIDHDSYQLT